MLPRVLPLLTALFLLVAPNRVSAALVSPATSTRSPPENACTAFFEGGSESRIGLLCHNDPVNKSDPTGLDVTFIFKDGTKVRTESGTEFAKIASNAEKGSLDAVIVKGHGTSDTQSFNSRGPAKSSDSGIVRAADGKAYVVDPANKSNGGVVGEIGSLLSGKFHDEGGARIGMIGCNTSNAKENVTRAVSAAVHGVQVYGEPRAMANPFWSGVMVPYPFGSHIYPPETVYINGELQR